jgi:hypothetical protein
MQPTFTSPCLTSKYFHALQLIHVKMHGFSFKKGGIAMAIVAISREKKITKNQLKISQQRQGRREPARQYIFHERMYAN